MAWAFRCGVFGAAVGLSILSFFAGAVTGGGYPAWISHALEHSGVPLWIRITAAVWAVPAGWIVVVFLILGFAIWTWVE